MSVSVTMPRLGESVSEGTVTRWLKSEGDHVEADEPLLEVSTDKVDTEIPAPASGVLSAIKVGEDETVEVGAELATISDGAAPAGAAPAGAGGPAQSPPAAASAASPASAEASAEASPPNTEPAPSNPAPAAAQVVEPPAPPAADSEQEQRQVAATAPAPPAQAASPAAPPQPVFAPPGTPQPADEPPADSEHATSDTAPADSDDASPDQATSDTAPADSDAGSDGQAASDTAPADSDAGSDGQAAYVTPLVRKLAAEQGVDLGSVTGTGVGGRIRKQDVLEAARPPSAAPAAAAPAAPTPPMGQSPSATEPPAPGPSTSRPAAKPAAALRGRTEKMSRLRTVIADRMVESLRLSAQLTTVVEADVTRIARLRQHSKATFEAREGVKLSYLPFFALATIDALKAHPNVNASIDVDAGTITYHDAEHLGIAVDTDRGLLVPVIQDAGDLNLGGLARKIADLAERTRTGKVSPDELGGGTFTLTNTGSRGALFDTPIINQPQVGILGTGSVVKRPVVVDHPELGEVISVRSMAYLALTYDHRLVDGADAARFLTTIKDRLEAGAFEAALGL